MLKGIRAGGFLLLLLAFASTVFALDITYLEPTYGTAIVDGNISEWDLAADHFKNQYEAGSPDKTHLSSSYMRYDCSTNTMFVLVLREDAWIPDMTAENAWVKIYDLSQSPQVDGNAGDDGTAPDFVWVYDGATLVGYEASFPLNEGTYSALEIHVNVDNGRTSSTGKSKQGYTQLRVDCPAAPPAETKIGDKVWEDLNGNGIQDAGEPGIESVTVALLDCDNSDAQVDQTQTNSSGEYSFTVTPGNYKVKFTAPEDYVFTPKNSDNSTSENDSDADESTGETACTEITSGEVDLSWDAGLYEPVRLGNFVWFDETRNNIKDSGEPALAGATIRLLNANGSELETDESSGSGYYYFNNLQPGTYQLKFELPAGNYAFVTPNAGSDDEKDSDPDVTTGLTAQFELISGQNDLTRDAGAYSPVAPSIDASIGNKVWEDLNGNGIQDSGEPGIAGVTVTLLDCDNGDAQVEQAQTNGIGEYAFTVDPGNYKVKFTAPDDYVFTPKNSAGSTIENDSDADEATGETACTEITSGEVDLSWDAGLYEPVRLGNFIWLDETRNNIKDSGEAPLADATIRLLDANGSELETDESSASGYYYFNDLQPGIYQLKFELPAGNYAFVTQNAGSDDEKDSDPDVNTGLTAQFELVSGQNDLTRDAGAYQAVLPGTIAGMVWYDDNDGIQEPGEKAGKTLTVELVNCTTGTVEETTFTDNQGDYEFENVTPGEYKIKLTLPANYVLSPKDAGQDDTVDSDAGTDGIISCFQLSSGETKSNLDFGLVEQLGSISGIAWYDDNDGIRENGELPVSNLKVELLNCDTGHKVDQMNTENDGSYSFTGLAAGEYTIQFDQPKDHVFAPQNAGADDIDSDANVDGLIACFELAGGENLTHQDGGIYRLAASIGNFVWNDANHNGVQDTDETGMAGVTVKLLESNGTEITCTKTDNSGYYLFAGLDKGTYKIKVVKPSGYTFTKQHQGHDAEKDSDVNHVKGISGGLSVALGDEDLTIDIGLLADSDGDLIADIQEGTGDSDGDGRPDFEDFDPAGYIYDEVNGEIISGGQITVFGPGIVDIVHDGSSGFFQFFITEGIAGIYTLAYTPPAGYAFSVNCLPQVGAYDPPSTTEPVVYIGTGSEMGSTGYMSDFSCDNNPYYFLFDLDGSDPEIRNNNIPLMRLPATADFTADTTWGIGRLCVQFQNESIFADTYLWDFGDGTTSTEENPYHCFSDIKKYYNVSLTAFNSTWDDTEAKDKYITVLKEAYVNFKPEVIAGPAGEFAFENQSGGSITHFEWNFGDGSTQKVVHGTMANEKFHPTHTYGEEGAYTVSLSGAGKGGTDELILDDIIYVDNEFAALTFVDGSEVSEGNGWEKAIDHDVLTLDGRAVAVNSNAWATFMFADSAKRALSKIRLANTDYYNRSFMNHRAQDIEIWTSLDGINFEQAETVSCDRHYAWNVVEFDAIPARYIRVVLSAAWGENSPFVSIAEVQAFGAPLAEMLLLKDGIEMALLNGAQVTDYQLQQNYPNPFNPSTTIAFALPEAHFVTLKIYNMMGQEIRSMINEVVPAGRYQVQFSAEQLPSGIYFYVLKAGSFNARRQMIFLK